MNFQLNKAEGFTLITSFAAIGLLQKAKYSEKKEYRLLSLKLRAAQLAKLAFDHISKVRQEIPLHSNDTPWNSTGLIGFRESPITTDRGYLRAKIATLNPNFASLIVQWLDQLNVRPGDHVAVGISGSLPALNICVYSAMCAMRVNPLIIASVGSSNWGANDPNFTWLEMEKSLSDSGILPIRSQMVSIGGNKDRGDNMTPDGVQMVRQKIQDLGLNFLKCDTTPESVDRRMAFYEEHSEGKPLRVYINVGGGVASVSRREKGFLQPGINFVAAVAEKKMSDSVMQRLGMANIPMIHLVMVRDLAEKYQLELPENGQIPEVGKGAIFNKSNSGLGRFWSVAILTGLVVGGGTLLGQLERKPKDYFLKK